MSKYDPLWKFIKKKGGETFRMTYSEIEKVTKFPLDHSLLVYKKELQDYGYSIGKISVKDKAITFNMIEPGIIASRKKA
mgnify:CR=1 FL=1